MFKKKKMRKKIYRMGGGMRGRKWEEMGDLDVLL